MKDTFKKPIDKQGRRYRTAKVNKELEREDEKWIESEIEDYQDRNYEGSKED